MKIKLILGFLLLGLTRADAAFSIGNDPPEIDLYDTRSRHGLAQAHELKQVPFRMMVPGDAAPTMPPLPFIQFIVKNFKAPAPDEWLVEFDRRLFRNIFVSATYTHRKYIHPQAAISDLTSSDDVCTAVIAANPTTGRSFLTQNCYLLTSIPEPGRTVFLTARGRNRSYDGLEMAVDKRMSSRVLLRFSGTVQNQNFYSPVNPTIFGGSRASNSIKNTGWDWSIKASGAYLFPHSITVGAYFEVVTGLVVPVWRGSSFSGNYAEGNLRAPDTASLNAVKYIDLKIEKAFAVRKYGNLSVSADIFNIFNMNSTQTLTETVPSFQFLEPRAPVNPRVISFELRYSY